MKVIEYSKEKSGEWDEFIKESRNGTFMNTRRFLSYHNKKFKDFSFMFYKKNKLIAVFMGCVENDKVISHSGATYGGIILSKQCKVKDVDSIVKAIILKMQWNNIKEIIIKLPPRIYHKYPSDEVDYILHYNRFEVKKRELSSVILLEEVDQSYMLKNTIVANKQARDRGVKVSLDDNYDKFWEILKDNLIKHNVKPTHTVEEIKKLAYLFPDNVKLFLAKKGNVIIGGSVVFIKGQTAHTQYMGMDYNYEKDRPLNAIIDFLIKYYKSKKYLSFGVSTPNGEYINFGLVRFKEGFGARGIVRETWVKQLL